jgi:hypothetical protein
MYEVVHDARMSGLDLQLALQDSGPAELVRIGLVDRRDRHSEDEGLLDGWFRITGEALMQPRHGIAVGARLRAVPR